MKNTEESENLQLMASAPVSKAILTLAIPTVLSTLISLLYNLTDTYFIGLLDGSGAARRNFLGISCIYGGAGSWEYGRTWRAVLYFKMSRRGTL